MKKHSGWLTIVGVGILAAWMSAVSGSALAQEKAAEKIKADTDNADVAVGEVAQDSAAEPEAAVSPKETLGPSETEAKKPSKGLISVDFKDADIRQVLRIISLKSGVDIVAGSDVEGLVTIKLTNVPWEQALQIILRTYGFTYERKGNIVRVLTLDALEQEALATEVFALNYAKAEEVPDIINEMLSDRGRVKFDERTNTVIVTDIPSNLFQIKEVVNRLDRRTPQVLVETKVVETRLAKQETLGIEWSRSLQFTQTQNSYPSSFPFKANGTFGELGDLFITPSPGQVPNVRTLLDTDPLTTLGSIGVGTLSTSQLSSTLHWLKTRSDTHIVSNPSLMVLNNQEAKVHIGQEFPLPSYTIDPTTGQTTISGFTSKDVGTVLTVTPHVNASEEIVVDLKPEVIAVGDNVTYDTGGDQVSLPQFTTQTAETQVRIKSADTVAIGGLVKVSEVRTESKIPILGDIPIVGMLFSDSDFSGGGDPIRQDLIIFLTVTLVNEGPPADASQIIAAAPQEE